MQIVAQEIQGKLRLKDDVLNKQVGDQHGLKTLGKNLLGWWIVVLESTLSNKYKF